MKVIVLKFPVTHLLHTQKQHYLTTYLGKSFLASVALYREQDSLTMKSISQKKKKCKPKACLSYAL